MITLNEQDREQYINKIDAILGDATYADTFALNFLSSFKGRLENPRNYNALTERQTDYLNKIISEYDGREQWEKEYKEKYLEVANIIAEYYSRSYGTSRVLANTIKQGQVPPWSHFLTVLEYKNTERMLANYNSEPKFEVGDFVMMRKRLPSMGSYFDAKQRQFSLQAGIIMSREEKVYSEVKGSRGYEILFNFNNKIQKVQERDIKEANDRNIKTVKNSDTSEKK